MGLPLLASTAFVACTVLLFVACTVLLFVACIILVFVACTVPLFMACTILVFAAWAAQSNPRGLAELAAMLWYWVLIPPWVVLHAS